MGTFSLNKGRLRLDDLVVEIFPAPAGGAGDWLAQTQTALAALRTRTTTRDPVVLVLPPHLTLTKLIMMPRVEPAKRGRVLRFAVEQSIPYAPSDVVWDTVVAAESEDGLEMLLAAAKREPIEALCAAVQAAGFEPRLVLPSALATLAVFRLVHDAPEEPAIVLNLGARSTTLLQVSPQRFAARSLALGTGTSKWRTAEPRDHVALEVIATRLAQEVTRSVMHSRRRGGEAGPGRIHLTGGGARLSGLDEALAAKVKIPVERLDLSGKIEIAVERDPTGAAGQDLMLTDLIGAAATQFRPLQPVLNLLPPSLCQRAGRRRLWLSAAALVVTVAAWPLASHLLPESRPARPATVSRQWAEPRVAEVPASLPVAGQIDAASPFDLELLDVKTAPFPLQLAGYFGESDDYLVAFTSAGQADTLLVRRGHRFDRFGLTLHHFEVRKIAVDHADPWPVYEVAGSARLHDEKTGAEVVVDSTRKPAGTLQAVLRGVADGEPSTRQEGELIEHRGATYRLQRIQADPPEVVVVREPGGSGMAESHVLRRARPEIQ